MKRILIILSLFLCTHLLQADFPIYQCWSNPKTGQKIHEFFDIHLTKKGSETSRKQQIDVAKAAKVCGPDSLVIVEGMADKYPGFFKLAEIGSAIDTAIYKAIQKSIDFAKKKIRNEKVLKVLNEVNAVFHETGFAYIPFIGSTHSGTPLSWMETVCKEESVDVLNVELRSSHAQLPTMEHFLAFNTNHEEVNALFRSLPKMATEIAHAIYLNRLERVFQKIRNLKESNLDWDEKALKMGIDLLIDFSKVALQPNINAMAQFIKENFVIDAGIIQAIFDNKDRNNIFVAAGATHLVHVNIVLKKLGFILKDQIIAPDLTTVAKQNTAVRDILGQLTNSTGSIKEHYLWMNRYIYKSFDVAHNAILAHCFNILIAHPINIQDIFAKQFEAAFIHSIERGDLARLNAIAPEPKNEQMKSKKYTMPKKMTVEWLIGQDKEDEPQIKRKNKALSKKEWINIFDDALQEYQRLLPDQKPIRSKL